MGSIGRSHGEMEGGALVEFGHRPDASPVFMNDALNRCQAHAGSFKVFRPVQPLIFCAGFFGVGEVIREIGSNQLLAGTAGYSFRSIVDVADFAVRRNRRKGVETRFDQTAVLGVRTSQRIFGFLTLRAGTQHRDTLGEVLR